MPLTLSWRCLSVRRSELEVRKSTSTEALAIRHGRRLVGRAYPCSATKHPADLFASAPAAWRESADRTALQSSTPDPVQTRCGSPRPHRVNVDAIEPLNRNPRR